MNNTMVRDQWFWALILTLTKEYDFQVVESPYKNTHSFLDPTGNELEQCLLLRNSGRQFELIRLQCVDFVWNSTLARDIRSFSEHIPSFRQKLKASHLKVYNVYLFPFSKHDYPIQALDEFESMTESKYALYTSGAYFKETELSESPQIDLATMHLTETEIKTDDLYNKSLHRALLSTIDQLKREIVVEEKRKEKKFNQIFHYGKPIWTFLILFINFVLFALMEWVGSSTDPETLIAFGAKWTPLIMVGEYWRLITPVFLHIGIVHILFNSLALYFLGTVVERIYGSMRFLWIYFFAGFFGTLASFLFNPHLAAGASGAIFGCFGALLFFGLKHRNLFFRTMGTDIIFILLFNLGIGFVIPIIDNYGHLGGLIGGFIAAALIGLPKLKS